MYHHIVYTLTLFSILFQTLLSLAIPLIPPPPRPWSTLRVAFLNLGCVTGRLFRGPSGRLSGPNFLLGIFGAILWIEGGQSGLGVEKPLI